MFYLIRPVKIVVNILFLTYISQDKFDSTTAHLTWTVIDIRYVSEFIHDICTC